MLPSTVSPQRWYEHVRATPVGFVPVVFAHGLLSYQLAGGSLDDVKSLFETSAPREAWPSWLPR